MTRSKLRLLLTTGVIGLLLGVQTMAATTTAVSFIRLYTDANGVSHFSKETLPLAPVAGGQGMEANLAVSRIGDVKGVMFAQLKAGATEDWHIAPRRQFMVCVQGVVEITASDGQKQRLTPGQFMLLEDTTGKGHITRNFGPDDRIALTIPLAEGVVIEGVRTSRTR